MELFNPRWGVVAIAAKAVKLARRRLRRLFHAAAHEITSSTATARWCNRQICSDFQENRERPMAICR